MACPKCGSNNVQVIAENDTKIKGYGICKGLLGVICFGPIGFICGLCGMGKGKSTTNTYRMCIDCGNKFK